MRQDNKPGDGADEQMLGSQEKDRLTGKRDDVKFTKNEDQLNGDAKIEIGVTFEGKDFTGMSREELMKYTNDPMWVRLRWIFFVAFWLIWVCMLVGAILIIVGAPKCTAPEKPSWFRRGPLLKRSDLKFELDTLKRAKKLQATGVIYEIPAIKTYEVGSDEELDRQIDNLIRNYKDSNINIILDITPNYVPKESKLFKKAIENKSYRSPFVWVESSHTPTNWVSHVNESAWQEVKPRNYVLSQFGENLYDLHMNDTTVKRALENILEGLMRRGVRGFRLKNSKFFLLSKNIEEEVPSYNPKYSLGEYDFWTHAHTTFQKGIGDYLSDIKAKLKMIDSDVFLTVTDDIVRPEVYQTKKGFFGIDTPRYGRLMHVLNKEKSGKRIEQELQKIRTVVGNHAWLQWEWEEFDENRQNDLSAHALFLALIPGVNIIPDSSYLIKNVSESIYKQIITLRNSPSFMYGDFHIYHKGDLVAYARIKSGNPGYLVIYNPTDNEVTQRFAKPFPEKMRVSVFSSNYNVTGVTNTSQVTTNSIALSPLSTIILSFVPVSSE